MICICTGDELLFNYQGCLRFNDTGCMEPGDTFYQVMQQYTVELYKHHSAMSDSSAIMLLKLLPGVRPQLAP
jgi:hypothetical protein